MNINHWLSICLLLFLIPLYAQQEFINGQLLDEKTNEPIVFATIGIQGKAIGVISNQDGGFRVPQIFRDAGEVLVISCMGYRSKTVALSDLSPESSNTIFLRPVLFELQEAVVEGKRKRPPSAKKIVKKAIDKIHENYPDFPFSTIGYYRDYQLKENEYVNLNEAILHIFDMGFEYNDLIHTKIQIYDYVRNLDFERDAVASGSYDYKTQNKIIENAFLFDFGGNELNILRIHDALRNYNVETYSFVYRLEKDLIGNHSFVREGITSLDGEPVYVISMTKGRPETFAKEVLHPNFRAKGKLYIAPSNYAIYKLIYEVYDHSPENKAKNERYTGKGKLLFKVAVEYKEVEGRMYPNYISFHNVFKIQRSLFRIEDVKFDSEDNCFIVRFNSRPVFSSDMDLQDYSMKYRNKRMKLKRIRFKDKEIYLYPDFEKLKNTYEELRTTYADKKYFPASTLNFNFGIVNDAHGHILNDFKYEELHQFREFFTHQIKPNAPFPEDGIFMKKEEPLHGDQPIVQPDNFDDYWMNTPLQKVEK